MQLSNKQTICIFYVRFPIFDFAVAPSEQIIAILNNSFKYFELHIAVNATLWRGIVFFCTVSVGLTVFFTTIKPATHVCVMIIEDEKVARWNHQSYEQVDGQQLHQKNSSTHRYKNKKSINKP